MPQPEPPRALHAAVKNVISSGIAHTTVLLTIFVFCTSGKGAALDPTSHISQYGHSVWRVQDGYFGGAPTAITQTTDGYIWVGTEAGLFKFDGLRFLRWSARSGSELPSSHILHLLGARDGSLWIGTDSGLAHLVNNRLILYQKTEGWIVADIIEDKEGKVWFTRIRAGDYTHALCQVVDAGVRCYGSEDGVDAYGILLAQDASGDLWVGGTASLARWRPGTSIVYRPRSLQSNPRRDIEGVEALAPAADGSLWVGMKPGRGAALQHIVAGTLQPFLAQKLNRETLEVSALCIDHQNSLWVGTTRGLYRIHGTDIAHYGSADGLSGDDVPQIFEDREGNVWVATSQGLDMFRDIRVKTLSKREGLNEDAAESVAASQDGNVWIATRRLQALGSQGVFFLLPRFPGAAFPGSLLVDHAGRLWAGMNSKLFVLEQAGFRQITKQDGSALGTVMGIAEDSEHTIWVESAGPPAALLRVRELKVKQEFLPPEIPLARKIVADPQNGIWLGLLTGDLARYRDGQLNTFTFGDHPNSRVLAITAASDGSILGGTAFGVVGWKNGKQQILTVRNGLPCNYVTALISDNAGNLWLDSQCGLVEIPKDQMKLWWARSDSKLSLRVFDTVDGVRPGLARFNTSAKTLDGRLWFANGSVVQVIDPAHMPENTVPPPLDISAVVADHKPYALGSAIRLPPLTRDLEIDYTALSYVAPQKVLFRYMLEGHDAGWQNPGTRRQAFYNDLRPDHYRFRVIASNNDGVWNKVGASVDFFILPAYYQTAWFRFACAAAVLLLLWAAYRLRVQRLERRFAIGLEARVNERTRIARDLHDTLLQSFQGLILRFQLVEDLLPEGKAKTQLEQTLQRADQAIAEGRRAVYDLRSSTAMATDLSQAVRSLGEEFTTENSAAFHLVVEGTARDLNPAVRGELYLIAREALRNAFSHARAQHIEAEIIYGEHELRLRIRDDGEGIPARILEEGRPGHYGLPGMHERAKHVGGKLDFWSKAGAGTEIDLSIPGSIVYRTSAARPLFSLFSLFRRKAG